MSNSARGTAFVAALALIVAARAQALDPYKCYKSKDRTVPQSSAVTVSLDEMTFLEPVHIGEVLTLHASVNDVGTTSMECGVRVEAENPITGSRVHAASAYLVFVAIDDDGHPCPVPPLLAESENELRRQREATLRRQTRMTHKEALRAARKGTSA